MAKKKKNTRTRKTIKDGNYLLPIGLLFICTGIVFFIASLIDGLNAAMTMASLFIIIGIILLTYNVAILSRPKK